jgi:AMP phosphorylase
MTYTKKLKAKIIDIEANKPIFLLNEKVAEDILASTNNRVVVRSAKECVTGLVDITNTVVDDYSIGIYKNQQSKLNINDGDLVEVNVMPYPESLQYIINKIKNKPLSEEEAYTIIKDVLDDKLSEAEISAFLTSLTINGLSLEETTYLCKALTNTGKTISFDRPEILDKHSIGGINGRVSMLVVPIIVANGYMMPKTASRSISSAAGTADCMEVLARVDLGADKIKEIVSDVGGVITWNGRLDLSPGDDKMIAIRHSLGLDPEGLVIASVLSKKKSAGSTHLIIDLPVGKEVKIKTREEAEKWAKKFLVISKELGIKTRVVLTNGEVPCGRNFGAALEAKSAFEILEGKYFDNLAAKACEIAGKLFDLVGKTKDGEGYDLARETIKSGKALEKFKEIIKAQEGNIFCSEDVPIAENKKIIINQSIGKIVDMDVALLTKIARLSGAPYDKGAGLVLLCDTGDELKEGDPILEIYANNLDKLDQAEEFAKENLKNIIQIERMILEEMDQ